LPLPGSPQVFVLPLQIFDLSLELLDAPITLSKPAITLRELSLKLCDPPVFRVFHHHRTPARKFNRWKASSR
jgi:hypothetical protein